MYWLLVQSVREGGRVRQRVVATLGALDARGRARAKALAAHLTGRRAEASWFEPQDEEADTARVRIGKVRMERARQFGNVYLGWVLWRSLQLDELLDSIVDGGREEISWSTLAAILVICRLCEPSSEWYLAEQLFRRTALDNLLGVPEEKINENRIYRALDHLLPHKDAIEKHLKNRLGEMFGITYDLLLYDVTSTYFEGLAGDIPSAQRGYSRDHRPDCKQVCIALVVTKEGIPLSYEVFDGNRTDVTTVEEIVETMEEKFGLADRVWVMDRGMASEDNLEWLREGDRKYVIGAVKSEMRKFEADLLDKKDWKTIREGVEVKQCEGPDGKETFILCRSTKRKNKDHAIVERFSKKLDKRLQSLQNRLARAKRKIDRAGVERQIGRILEQCSRVSGKYIISVNETNECASGLQLVLKERVEWAEWVSLSEGCYLLRSNITNWSEEDLWKSYIQLTQAESAFRIQKSELSIRPIWHHREDRVHAHIFVCFLAYVLWKALEQWQQRAGLGNSPRTLLDELSQIQSADVILPTVEGPELKIRCVVKPDGSKQALLDRLGLEIPKRLKMPKAVIESTL
ncbi:MAG: IS1634 family transposase [Planctomycetes bacterium]|nr:IS1634 family transposase [Planctomycetota bacterium]